MRKDTSHLKCFHSFQSHHPPTVRASGDPFIIKSGIKSDQSSPSLCEDIKSTLSKTAQNSDKLCPTFQEMCNTLNKMTDSGVYPETNSFSFVADLLTFGFLGLCSLGESTSHGKRKSPIAAQMDESNLWVYA